MATARTQSTAPHGLAAAAAAHVRSACGARRGRDVDSRLLLLQPPLSRHPARVPGRRCGNRHDGAHPLGAPLYAALQHAKSGCAWLREAASGHQSLLAWCAHGLKACPTTAGRVAKTLGPTRCVQPVLRATGGGVCTSSRLGRPRRVARTRRGSALRFCTLDPALLPPSRLPARAEHAAHPAHRLQPRTSARAGLTAITDQVNAT